MSHHDENDVVISEESALEMLEQLCSIKECYAASGNKSVIAFYKILTLKNTKRK